MALLQVLAATITLVSQELNSVFTKGQQILPGLPWPQALQGHDDENWPLSLTSSEGGPTDALRERYEVLGKMSPGIRRYNVWWSTFESEMPSNRNATHKCPKGTSLVPSNESDRIAYGYARFHCYNDLSIARFDTIFAQDSRIGAQCAAILYSAPNWARHPNCTGFQFGPDHIRNGCAPMNEYMADFQDYVLFLVRRWSRTSLKHLVIWNEVASAGWMDMSPYIPNRAGPSGSNPLTDDEFDLWVSKYADMVSRAALALKLAGFRDSVMVWTSNDRLWERPIQHAGQPLHTGVKPFLDHLWPKLGANNVTFGTAVHPYDPGNPYDDHEFAPGHHPQAYTFATLDTVVAYAKQQVRSVLSLRPTDPKALPYQLLFASEQGWPSPACCDDRIRARNICYAHALSATLPQMVAVTHNFFHDSPGGSQQGGQDYGLIPGNVTGNLANGPGHPTFDAYIATSPESWELSDDHMCCSQWRMGCKTKGGLGTLDPLLLSNNSLQIHGWAWDERAPHAGSAPLRVRISFEGIPIPPIVILANTTRNDIVSAGVAPNPDHGFIVSVANLSSLGINKSFKVFAAYIAPDGTPIELDQSPRCADSSGPHPCTV